MERDDQRDAEMAALRERLARLGAASLRINENLDLDVLLQGVVDGARSLTGARYGALTVFADAGALPHFLVSGMTAQEHQGFWDMPEGLRFFEYVSGLETPLRVADFGAHLEALGMPDFRPAVPVTSLLVMPIRHRDVGVGSIYLSGDEAGGGFTQEDEEFVAMFASQAALVIANARRYREERRARNDLETLVATSPVGVVVLDARTGAPVSVNREAARVVDGLREGEQTAEDLLEVVTCVRGDGREVSLRELPLAELLQTGETVRAEEIALRVPGGRSVSVLLNATPIHGEDGRVASFVVTLQDLTPLEETERRQAEFLGMVSHELRTPLSSVKGSVTNLLDPRASLDPAEVAQFHRIIDAQADRMRDLIGDLLDVARIQTGSLSVAPVPAELAALVDEARSAFLSGGGRQDVRVELPPGLPAVMADRRRIVQVLGNLLSNASRNSPGLPVIRIAAEPEGLHVRVTVTDQGRGIPADRLTRLFRRFSRFDTGDETGDDTGDRESDTGLGLAICKGIVEAHGGRIWAESDGLGLGARFSFTLPAAAEGETSAGTGTGSSGGRSSRGATERPRVLAVDDDPQTLRNLRDALTRAGYAVTVTADPADVSHLLVEEEPDLVLLDLMLPGASGLELMEVVRAMVRAPVIFLSAYDQDQVIAAALEQGAADYIVKPFSHTELAARIQAALRKREPSGPDYPGQPYVLGGLAVDYARRRVTVAGEPVELTPLEYRLLVELSVNAGRVMEHELLLWRVWGQEESGGSTPVRTYVKRLRRKLGDDPGSPRYIFTQRRVGYWMPEGEG